MSHVRDIEKVTSNWKKRVDWDQYFISLALLTASRSSCNRLKVGCVLVKDNRIISTGYNGFLPSAPHVSIVRDNHEQATVHAEQNAISYCAANLSSSIGATAYITHYPCINCTKILAASGIKEIKYLNDYKNDDLVIKILDSINIKISKID